MQLGSLPQPMSIVSIPLHSSAGSAALSAGSATPLVSWSSGSPLSAGMSLPQSSSLLGAAEASPHLSPNQPGLCLSPAVQTFPQRLVDRIRAGHFVEMRELLADNILLLQELKSLPGSSPSFMQFPAVARPRLHEVRSMTVWLYCFLAYMAIRTTDPATRDQLGSCSGSPTITTGRGGWNMIGHSVNKLLSIHQSGGIPWFQAW